MSISGVGSGAAYMRPFQPPSFSSIDSNASGDITLDELNAGAPGGASDAKSARRAEKLFAAMDADSNGSVTSDEKDAFDSKLAEQRQAMQFMTQLMAGGHKPPSNENIFAATDLDGSGAVSSRSSRPAMPPRASQPTSWSNCSPPSTPTAMAPLPRRNPRTFSTA